MLVNWAECGNMVFEAAVVSCSDTQILTGLAFGACTYFQQCKISAYHYDIVEDLLLMTCATHMVTFSAVRNNFQLVSILRLACVATIYGITMSLLIYQAIYGAFPVPNLTSKIDQAERLMWPAACFSEFPESRVTHEGTARLWGSLTATGFGLFWGMSTIEPRQFYLDVEQFFADENDYGSLHSPDKDKQVLAYGAIILIICTGFVINILAYISIQNLRDFISTLVKSVDEEDNVNSFGQFLVIILTGLIVLTFFDNAYSKSIDALKVFSWPAVLIS